MRKLSSTTQNITRIKLCEDSVTDFLEQTKSPLIYNFLSINLMDNVYSLLVNFYCPSISFCSSLSLNVGDRILFRELSSNNLNHTGRACFRFIQSLSVQAGFGDDEDIYSVILSVIPVLSKSI